MSYSISTLQIKLQEWEEQLEKSIFPEGKQICESRIWDLRESISKLSAQEEEKIRDKINDRVTYLIEQEGKALKELDNKPVGSGERVVQWQLVNELGARKNELQEILKTK